MPSPFSRILVANRGEIAIRVFRTATELGLHTVAIYSHEDRYALHRFKADESYLVGAGRSPVEAYLAIDDVIRIAKDAGVDAIHPGYGFLSENPTFAQACRDNGLVFVGPATGTMRRFGNKVAARELAVSANIPVMPASGPLPPEIGRSREIAQELGFPLMLKASWGGGGRGMRIVRALEDVEPMVSAARQEAAAAFGNDEVYFERYVGRARHVEVQILGDSHGNVIHLGERDCSIQRRHQKVVEQAPARGLTRATRDALCEAAVTLGRAVDYDNAGTVEFLVDVDTDAFYFIEVNPRIQVEHTVTEMVTGIDLVKAQILVAGGARLGSDSALPSQEDVSFRGFAMQCRITTEDPEHGFAPSYGTLTVYRPATGFGIRLDGAAAYAGATITPFYDSLLEKVTAWAPTFEETCARMLRALREYRVRGVETNIAFLEALISNADFRAGNVTTRFLDETTGLLEIRESRDRASRLLSFIGETIVNGNPEVRGRAFPAAIEEPRLPLNGATIAPGTRERLRELGPAGFARWMLAQERALVTDTTFRDAHQSLLATRMRTFDLLRIAPAYAERLAPLFSLECWGGATFDVALRFLKEDPWDRLVRLRELVPNILFQMLLRGANAVGYTNYPDNVVRLFVRESAQAGVDLFRIFDSLNWVENMRVSIDAVLESGALCEAAMCYTGDITDPSRTKYDLKYFVELAKALEKTGAHILGIKDMAGVCKPEAARRLVSVLKEEIGIPIHFHTHDTSGNSGASVLAAIEAGVDAVDGAIDAMSGLTSQPNLGAIVQALRNTPRETGLDAGAIAEISSYWETVRRFYAPFESDMRSGTSDVYEHAIPGGQVTNLREQATSLAIGDRWPEITKTYAAVNRMFGDIVKVTPTSKVVGDMALFMITSGLTIDDVADPKREIAFPHSVIELFHGDIGQPPGGFPLELQRKILGDREPITARPGSLLPPADLEAMRAAAEKEAGVAVNDRDLASYLMYPQVFVDYAKHNAQFGDVEALPTPVFFYGMQAGEEIAVEIERGKTLIIRYAASGEIDENGNRTLFFELNGQPRAVKVRDHSVTASKAPARKADAGNAGHVGAPMPAVVAKLAVEENQVIARGAPLLTLEAMKMQTAVSAPIDGVVRKIVAPPGTRVEAGDLLVEIAPAD
jgi:pyruvate carboxylase